MRVREVVGLLSVTAVTLAGSTAWARHPSPPPPVARTPDAFDQVPPCLVAGSPGPALAPYFDAATNPFVLASPTRFHFHPNVSQNLGTDQVELYRLEREKNDADPLSPKYWARIVEPTASGEWDDVPLRDDGGAFIVTVGNPGAGMESREVRAKCRLGFSQLWSAAPAPVDPASIVSGTWSLAFDGVLVPPTQRARLHDLASGVALHIDADDGIGDDPGRMTWTNVQPPLPTWDGTSDSIPLALGRTRYRVVACSDEPLARGGAHVLQQACVVVGRFTPDAATPCTVRVSGPDTLPSESPIDVLELARRSSLMTYALVRQNGTQPVHASTVQLVCGGVAYSGLPPGAARVFGNLRIAHTDLALTATSRLGPGRTDDHCPDRLQPHGDPWRAYDGVSTSPRDVAVCAYRSANWVGDRTFRPLDTLGGAEGELAFLKRLTVQLVDPAGAATRVQLDPFGRFWLKLPRPLVGPWRLELANAGAAATPLATYPVQAVPVLQLANPPTSLAFPNLRAAEVADALRSLCLTLPTDADPRALAADGGLTLTLRTAGDRQPFDARYAPEPGNPRRLCPAPDAAAVSTLLEAIRRSMLDGRPNTLEVAQGERLVVPGVPLAPPTGITLIGAVPQLASTQPLARPLSPEWPTGLVNALCVQTPMDLGAETMLLSATTFELLDDGGHRVGTFAAPPGARVTFFRRTPVEAPEHLYCAVPSADALSYRHLGPPSSTTPALRFGLPGLSCDDAALAGGRCVTLPMSPFEVKWLGSALSDSHAGFAWGPVVFWGLTPPVPTEWRSSLSFPLASVSMQPSSTVALRLEAGVQGSLAAGMTDTPALASRFAAGVGGYAAGCVAVDLPREAGALAPAICVGAALDLIKAGVTGTSSGIAPSFTGGEVVPYVGFELHRWK